MVDNIKGKINYIIIYLTFFFFYIDFYKNFKYNFIKGDVNMAINIQQVKIILRHDSPENWKLENPILKYGEVGIEIDDEGYSNIKISNGKKSWNELPYLGEKRNTIDNIFLY